MPSACRKSSVMTASTRISTSAIAEMPASHARRATSQRKPGRRAGFRINPRFTAADIQVIESHLREALLSWSPIRMANQGPVIALKFR